MLEVKDLTEPSIDLAKQSLRHLPDPIGQVPLVQRDEGGHVDNRVTG